MSKRIIHAATAAAAVNSQLNSGKTFKTFWLLVFYSRVEVKAHFSLLSPESSTSQDMSYRGYSKSSIYGSYGNGEYSYGTNSQGNHYCTRGPSAGQGGAYHYSNTSGSYYYQNQDESSYYNDSQGYAKYTAPSDNPRTRSNFW